ncbi:Protein of unknown function [Cotesia congregata]|uniref:Reverse transcriptase domain-containing protein n=1 Tax=Cotesia congregata TaxID=51543 RepID=A0A8J2HLA7_COTCN|nr:Protein of unknown function [Cotesia congregata]
MFLSSSSHILTALYELGFSLDTIAWFLSYLSNRSQSILDDHGTPIQLLTTSSGPSQGSVLGPILFLIVINSVVRWLIYCKHGLFADDTYIYQHFFIHQFEEAVRQVNLDAQSIANSANAHGLELNLSKTKAMILGSNGRLRQLQEFDSKKICIVILYIDSVKCLGVYIDRSLSWNTHVSQVVRKVNSALHCLKVRKNIFTKELRKILVTATILPLLDYCSAVLVDATAEKDRKLQHALNASIRFIFDLRRDVHISPYRKDLSWLSVKYRRMYFMTCLLYKLLSVGKPNYLRNLFVKEADIRRSDRLAAKKHTSFELPRFTKTYLEHSFLVIVIRVWEELPSDIVNSDSLEVFRNKVFDYFLELDF